MRRLDKLKLRLQQEQHYRDNYRVAESNPVSKVGKKEEILILEDNSNRACLSRQSEVVDGNATLIDAERVAKAAHYPETPSGAEGGIRVAESNPVRLPVVFKPQIPKIEKRERHFVLVTLAYCLGVIGIGVNGWFAYSRGVSEIDRVLMCSLGFIAEAIMFYLPAQATNHFRNQNYGWFIFGSVVYVFLFAFALTNSLGFASINLHDIATARAERITPALSDAQRRLDTLTASRAAECLKRGDRCRQLEKDEQTALESLREARERVSDSSDPQVTSASKLVSWLSLGRYNPTGDDFAMLRLLLLTLLPQLGGLVLMLSQKG